MEKEIRLIRRGVPRQEYLDYFLSVGSEISPGHFLGKQWTVTVGEEREVKVLNCSIAEAEVIFRGEENVIRQLIDDFRLKFLRAGG